MNEKRCIFKKIKHKPTVKTNIIFIIMFVLLTFADQLTKWLAVHNLMDKNISLISGVLELHYLENRGAAWGMLENQTWFLILIPILVMGAIIYGYMSLPPHRHYTLLRFSLVLLAAGATGNFIDRIFNHYVVDFIYVSIINFPVFNIADCYVCIASACILYCIIIKHKDENLI